MISKREVRIQARKNPNSKQIHPSNGGTLLPPNKPPFLLPHLHSHLQTHASISPPPPPPLRCSPEPTQAPWRRRRPILHGRLQHLLRLRQQGHRLAPGGRPLRQNHQRRRRRRRRHHRLRRVPPESRQQVLRERLQSSVRIPGTPRQG